MLKKTKIIATISDKRCEVDFLKTLFDNGMNVVRLNTAHLDLEKAEKIITNVRKVSNRIAILIDTKGPEIRTSGNGKEITVKTGDKVLFYGDPKGETEDGKIFVSYRNITDVVKKGDLLLIDDGEIEFQVVENKTKYLDCVATNNGVVKLRKGVNIPNVEIDLPTLSNKDLEFIQFAINKNIDFIAHSFVRTKQDVIDIKNILKKADSPIKVIAKIENRQGIDNIDEILDVVYGVMVARGDLGIEIPAERIPVVQRALITKCVESKKPVIIATQMLHTMIEHPRPTRAEVSDVAGAIYQRADAIMLSGETASGLYPAESVRTMTEIAYEVESILDTNIGMTIQRVKNELTATLAQAAVNASITLPLTAIIVDTLTGRTGRYLAAYRPKTPIFAMCYNETVMRQLGLTYGVMAFHMEHTKSRDSFLSQAISKLITDKNIKSEDLVAIVGGSFGPTNGASFMEISQAKNLSNGHK
ncbi:MAG: pyruvate kinase [Salinivirgaceae bacterium]|nr:pyruvate kinase [Salinivirgaceae bacterium]